MRSALCSTSALPICQAMSNHKFIPWFQRDQTPAFLTVLIGMKLYTERSILVVYIHSSVWIGGWMNLIPFEFPVYSLSRPLNANDINVIMRKEDTFLWNLTIFKHSIRHKNPMMSRSKNGTWSCHCAQMDITLKLLRFITFVLQA